MSSTSPQDYNYEHMSNQLNECLTTIERLRRNERSEETFKDFYDDFDREIVLIQSEINLDSGIQDLRIPHEIRSFLATLVMLERALNENGPVRRADYPLTYLTKADMVLQRLQTIMPNREDSLLADENRDEPTIQPSVTFISSDVQLHRIPGFDQAKSDQVLAGRGDFIESRSHLSQEQHNAIGTGASSTSQLSYEIPSFDDDTARHMFHSSTSHITHQLPTRQTESNRPQNSVSNMTTRLPKVFESPNEPAMGTPLSDFAAAQEEQDSKTRDLHRALRQSHVSLTSLNMHAKSRPNAR